MPRTRLMITSALALAMASLALQGCNQQGPGSQQAAQPITGAPIASLGLAEAAPPPMAAAPSATQLPSAGRIRVAGPRAPRERYRYIDDAYRMSDAFGDTPPDYTVDYQGSRPWVWRAQNGAYRVVEYTPDGERDYYYRGGGDQPFLIRDPRYAYAYDGGELVDVYDTYGRPVPMDVADREADMAARYLSRARALHFAALHQQRQAAYAADWRDRREAVVQSRNDWAAEQQRNEDWRRWHDDRGQQDQGGWVQERSQRQNYAAQIAAVVAAGAVGAALQHSHDQARTADRIRHQQAEAARPVQAQQQQAAAQAQQGQNAFDAARADAQARQQQQAQVDAAHRADAQAHANGQQAQLIAKQQAEAANAQRAAQSQAQLNAQLAAKQQSETANAQKVAQERAQLAVKQQTQAADAARLAQMQAQQKTQLAAKQQAEAASAQRAAQAQATLNAQLAARQQSEAANAQRAAQDRAQLAARQQAQAANAQHAAQAQATLNAQLAAKQQSEAANAQKVAQERAQLAVKQQAQAANAQRLAQMQAQQKAQVEAANAQKAAQAASAKEQIRPAAKPAPKDEKKKPEPTPQQ